MKKIILFTDLDGTLLDEQTYSADLSLPALRDLQANGVSIVFCSSKTRAEQEVIRQELGVTDPFIVENGSAVIVPPDTVKIEGGNAASDGNKVLMLGKPLAELRTILKQVVAITGVAYQSFYDLSPEQIAQITGLDLESAQRAKVREFSETIVTKFNPSDLEIFIRECELRDLQCTFGGRFLSVTGKGADKGRAVQALAQHYRSQFGDVITIGVGDSPNDAPMLQEVDFPYLVQRPDGQWRKGADVTNLTKVPAIGPLGFAKMVKGVKQRWFADV